MCVRNVQSFFIIHHRPFSASSIPSVRNTDAYLIQNFPYGYWLTWITLFTYATLTKVKMLYLLLCSVSLHINQQMLCVV